MRIDERKRVSIVKRLWFSATIFCLQTATGICGQTNVCVNCHSNAQRCAGPRCTPFNAAASTLYLSNSSLLSISLTFIVRSVPVNLNYCFYCFPHRQSRCEFMTRRKDILDQHFVACESPLRLL